MDVATKLQNKAPDIYQHLDFRNYLLQWMAYEGNDKAKYSIRQFAKMAGMSFGHLSEILGHKRRINHKVFQKIAPLLKLSSTETNFLWHLTQLTDAKTHKARQSAYESLCRFSGYKDKHKLSQEAYRYISNWYYLAIREMAGMKDFRADPKWILSRLKHKVSLKEVEDCLSFLKEKGYLTTDEEGKTQLTNDLVQCDERVLRFATANAHRQFLGLAESSIYNTESEKRELRSYTFSMSQDDLSSVKEVMNEAMEKLKRISKNAALRDDRDEVYNVSLLAFPLTKK